MSSRSLIGTPSSPGTSTHRISCDRPPFLIPVVNHRDSCSCAEQTLVMLSIQDPARDIGCDQVEQFVAAPGQDGPNCVEGEALCLLGGDRRWDRQLLTCDHNVDER